MQGFPDNILLEIRKHLEEEKTTVTARIAELTRQDPLSDVDRLIDNAASDAEANEEFSHDRYTAMIGELTPQLEAINGALIRIGDGTYGFCTQCGTMIDTDRLAILPYATMCLSCEKKK